MDITVFVLSAVISFFAALLIAKPAIKFLSVIGLKVVDVHKLNKPKIPLSGGLIVLFGISAGIFFYIFSKTFFGDGNNGFTEILAALVSLYIVFLIGFFDDLKIKKDKSESMGLSRWQKILLVAPAAIPLMVLKSGTSQISLPFMGNIDVGLIYPLLLLPIGVICAANMVNILEGLNGLGAGMGLLYTLNLAIYTYINNKPEAALIALALFASLLAFIFFNWAPAKILPGDSLTYILGVSIAIIAILGNIEKAAIITSMPFIIEVFLKLRGGLKKATIGFVDKQNKLHSNYSKIYSLPHIFMRMGKYTERQIVIRMMLIQLTFCILAWLV